jgi:hypothetical protein
LLHWCHDGSQDLQLVDSAAGTGALALLQLGPALLRVYQPSTGLAAGPAAADSSASGSPQLPTVDAHAFAQLASTGGTLVALVLWAAGIFWLAVSQPQQHDLQATAVLQLNL